MTLDEEKKKIRNDAENKSDSQVNSILNSFKNSEPVKSSVGQETKVVNKQRVVPKKSSRVKQVNLNVPANNFLVDEESKKSIEEKHNRVRNSLPDFESGNEKPSNNSAKRNIQKKPVRNENLNAGVSNERKSPKYSSENKANPRRNERVVKKKLPDSKPLKKSAAISEERIRNFVEPKTNGRISSFPQSMLPDAGNELTRSDKINATRPVLKRERKLLKIGALESRESLEHASSFEPLEKTDARFKQNAYEAAAVIAGVNAAQRLDQSTMRIPRPSEEMLRQMSSDSDSRVKKVNNLEDTQPIGVIPEGGRDSVFPLPKKEARKKEADNSRLKSINVDRSYSKSNKRRVRPWIKWVVIAVIVVFCAAGFIFCKQAFDDAPMDQLSTKKFEFTVDENTNNDTVASFLVENGMVENELFYKIRAKFFDAEYVPGTYEISPAYSTEKIINILSGYDYSADSNS